MASLLVQTEIAVEVAALETRAHPFVTLSDRLHLSPRYPIAGELCDQGLKDGKDRKCRFDFLDSHGRDPRSPVQFQPHQPVGGHDLQGFSHQGPRDAERLAERALQSLLSGREIASRVHVLKIREGEVIFTDIFAETIENDRLKAFQTEDIDIMDDDEFLNLNFDEDEELKEY